MPVEPGALDRNVNNAAWCRVPDVWRLCSLFRGRNPGFDGTLFVIGNAAAIHSRTNMITRIACAAVVAIAMTAAPAFAKSKTAACSDDGIAKVDAAVMKMPDGDNKTAAMQEMTSAKSSMSQKDMAGCSLHMSKAMKLTTMKAKKT
jgi:hypothetical protein